MVPEGGYPEHVLDLLVQAGPPFDTGTRLRRMFGGHGVFCDGVMFALIADDLLFLKVDDATRPDFLAAGCTPFIYEKAGKPVAMSYVSVPEDAHENVEALRPWALLALAAANRAHAAKNRKAR